MVCLVTTLLCVVLHAPADALAKGTQSLLTSAPAANDAPVGPAWVAFAVVPRTSSSSFAADRSVNLDETGHLHSTGSHGPHLNEQGSVSGTIHGTVYVHADVNSLHSFVAEVNFYQQGGSLTGSGSASYHVERGYDEFSGGLSITRGSGSYAHAHARNLRFTGSIQRSNYAATVKLSGTVYY